MCDVHILRKTVEAGQGACCSQADFGLLLSAPGVSETVHSRDLWGFTPLHTAAQRSCAVAVTPLVRAKADVNSQSTSKWTPLLRAVGQGESTASLATIAELLRQGAHFMQPNKPNKMGSSVLAMSAQWQRTQVLRLLQEQRQLLLAANTLRALVTTGDASERRAYGPLFQIFNKMPPLVSCGGLSHHLHRTRCASGI